MSLFARSSMHHFYAVVFFAGLWALGMTFWDNKGHLNSLVIDWPRLAITSIFAGLAWGLAMWGYSKIKKT